MSYGNKPFGMTPFGGAIALFSLVDVSAVNPYTVVLSFSEPPNLDSPDTKDPANYYIQRVLGETTNLPVTKVVPDPDPQSIRLITSEQSYTLYNVRVNEITESIYGSTVNPLLNSKNFTGFPQVGRLRAQAILSTRILIIFNQEMLANADFLSTLSYAVFDPDGAAVGIASVTPNLAENPTRLTLDLDAPLVHGVAYSLTVSDKVVTTLEMTVVPSTSKVTWYNQQRLAKISLAKFTGEVQAPPPDTNRRGNEVIRLEESLSVEMAPYRVEPPQQVDSFQETLRLSETLSVHSNRFSGTLWGISLTEELAITEIASFTKVHDSRSTVELSLVDQLQLQEALEILPRLENQTAQEDSGLGNLFGNPQGLVFFSPSLITGGVSNSTIQVDQVKTCTEAHDTYTFPRTLDPKPLYTYGGGIVATPVPISTLNNASLFAEFYRLGEAKLNLSNRLADVVPLPEDITTGVVISDVDPTKIATLNNPGFLLFKSPLPPVGGFIPLDDHTSPAWVQFDASLAAVAHPFITASNLSPIPGPIVHPTKHYVSPMETLGLSVDLQPGHGVRIGVGDTVSLQEDFDLVPGETTVQVNLSESLTLSESVGVSLGLRLFETITVSEGLSLSS